MLVRVGSELSWLSEGTNENCHLQSVFQKERSILSIYLFETFVLDKIQCCFTDFKRQKPLNTLGMKQVYSTRQRPLLKPHSWVHQSFLVLTLRKQRLEKSLIRHSHYVKVYVYSCAYLIHCCAKFVHLPYTVNDLKITWKKQEDVFQFNTNTMLQCTWRLWAPVALPGQTTSFSSQCSKHCLHSVIFLKATDSCPNAASAELTVLFSCLHPGQWRQLHSVS